MRALLAVVVIFGASACSRPKDSKELVGKYSADYDLATEKIQLDDNGTFKQTVTLKSNGKVSSVQGAWKYYPSLGYIDFDEKFMTVQSPFNQLNPDYDRPRKTGTVAEPADKYFGRIYIGTSKGVMYRSEKD